MNYELNIQDIERLIEYSKREKTELGQIINPILKNYDLEEKEILEVCQIGKFVYEIDSEIRITDKPQPPSPDFIISLEQKCIGLEHTRILTDDASRNLKIKSLLNHAAQIFESKYPDINVHAIISIKNDKLDYKKKEKLELAEKIADFVQCANLQLDFKLPYFITGIRTTKHSKVSFSYKEKNFQSEYLTRNRLKQEIQKKENKISGYRASEFKIDEFWLVLLIGSLSSVSYELNELEDYKMDSKFDRVYLMADFDAEIVRVK